MLLGGIMEAYLWPGQRTNSIKYIIHTSEGQIFMALDRDARVNAGHSMALLPRTARIYQTLYITCSEFRLVPQGEWVTETTKWKRKEEWEREERIKVVELRTMWCQQSENAINMIHHRLETGRSRVHMQILRPDHRSTGWANTTYILAFVAKFIQASQDYY